jgi:hypothetical protein
MMQNGMLPIAEHASQLAKLLDRAADPLRWLGVAEWLTVASGITSVHFDTIRFNDAYGYCGSGDQFEAARDTLLQQYVTELTRFTYCWASLECAVKTIDPPAPSRKRKGKIDRACYYIKRHSPSDKGVLYYWDVLHDFRQLLVSVEEDKALQRFKAPCFVSARSLGLYVIYAIRNQFAHGALCIPLPDEDNRPRSHYLPLVELATRITLMSIQHLLAGAHASYTHTWEMLSDDGDELEHEFHRFLASLHIDRPANDGQLRLL